MCFFYLFVFASLSAFFLLYHLMTLMSGTMLTEKASAAIPLSAAVIIIRLLLSCSVETTAPPSAAPPDHFEAVVLSLSATASSPFEFPPLSALYSPYVASSVHPSNLFTSPLISLRFEVFISLTDMLTLPASAPDTAERIFTQDYQEALCVVCFSSSRLSSSV